MNLKTINEQLEEILKKLPKAILDLNDKEYTYNLKFAYALSHSPAGSREGREADATLTCEQENVLKPFIDARVELRTLTHEKEILIEMSRNIRALRGTE